MAKLKLSTTPAKANASGGFAVVFDLTGKPDPFPARVIEATKLDAVKEALDAYKDEAAALSVPLVVTVSVIEGRAPGGFNAFTKAAFYHPVNV